MTVYIAICDNNIADRKQLERLLEREKDKRLHENGDVLYIDSFGSEDAVMATPIKYDIFFIDVTDGSSNGMEIAIKLRKHGIAAPIVLCESTISYNSYVNAPENIIYIEKPVNAGQVSNLTDVALEWTAQKTPLIEVRCKNETHFIKNEELVRAMPIDKYSSRVCLSDGSSLEMAGSIETLVRQCRSFNCFIMCKKDLVNICHIESADKNSFRLSNGDTVTFGHRQREAIIKILASNLRYLRIQ